VCRCLRVRLYIMRFQLIDRITDVTPGQKLAAVKNLTLAEEYLAEHFPTFPVMPGVLMLETLVQAAAWLLRISDQFTHSIVAVREVKGLKFGTFMEPGRQMKLSVEVQGTYKDDARTVSFKGSGEQEGQSVVNARFVLERYNLTEKRPDLAATDEQLRQHYRQLYLLLRPTV
jgi:3-hydroxyacyl-[acyl-carrier-protein] dehydratase